MLTRLIALVAKEFLALLKDKRSRTVIIVPPAIQLLVFGYAATYDLMDVPYAVYNEDRGEASRELLAAFSGTPHFRQVRTIGREEELRRLLEERRVMMVVRVREDFTSEVLSGNGGAVQVVLDARNSNTALIALNYVRAIVMEFNMRWIEERRGGRPAAVLVTRAWYNPNLESRWFIVPGIVGLLTLVVTVLVTGLSVAREREHGTFDQLLVTPYTPFELLVGKALPGFIIGLGEATIIIVLAVLWFRIPLRGSLPTLYAGLVLFLFSAVGMGLMISSFAATMQQGLLGAFMFLVPSVILSGFTTPIENMPVAVQKMTLLNPMRYFMVVVRGVFLEDLPFTRLVDQFWPMAVIGLVALTLAGWLFRHRLY